LLIYLYKKSAALARGFWLFYLFPLTIPLAAHEVKASSRLVIVESILILDTKKPGTSAPAILYINTPSAIGSM